MQHAIRRYQRINIWRKKKKKKITGAWGHRLWGASSNGAVQSAIKRTLLDGLHDDILEEGDDRAGIIAADDGAARDNHVGPCLGRESGQGLFFHCVPTLNKTIGQVQKVYVRLWLSEILRSFHLNSLNWQQSRKTHTAGSEWNDWITMPICGIRYWPRHICECCLGPLPHQPQCLGRETDFEAN